MPINGFRDSALFAVDDLLQARRTVCGDVRAELDADPTPAHLMSYGGSRPGSKVCVQHEIAGISRDLNHAMQQLLGLGGVKHGMVREKRQEVSLCGQSCACYLCGPQGLRCHLKGTLR